MDFQNLLRFCDTNKHTTPTSQRETQRDFKATHGSLGWFVGSEITPLKLPTGWFTWKWRPPWKFGDSELGNHHCQVPAVKLWGGGTAENWGSDHLLTSDPPSSLTSDPGEWEKRKKNSLFREAMSVFLLVVSNSKIRDAQKYQKWSYVPGTLWWPLFWLEKTLFWRVQPPK